MIKLLMRVRLSALFHISFAPGKKKKDGEASPKKISPAKVVLFAILYAYLVLVFFGLFSMAFFGLSMLYFGTSNEWVYFSMFVILSFAVLFLGSVFTAKSEIFEAKDNEILLTMPIRPRDILASRMLTLLVVNFAFESVVALPAAGVWVLLGSPTLLGGVAFLFTFLSLPFFGLAISCLFAWLISIITSKMPKKTFATVFFSLLFFVLYFYFVSNAESWVIMIGENGAVIAEAIGGILPLYWVGSSIAGGGNLLHLLFSLLIYLLPFVAVYAILAKSFIKIVTAKAGTGAKKAVGKAEFRASTLQNALLKREFSRLLSSATYLLNNGLSIPFAIIIAVVAAVQKNNLLVNFEAIPIPDLGSMLCALFAGGLCFLCSMGCFTASSISLEGKTLWLLRSLPVSGADVLRAKLKMSIWLTAPTNMLAGLILAVAYRPDPAVWLLLLTVPALFSVFSANLGLICNLCHPVFDWINEAQAVKQGVSMLLTMLFTSLSALVLLGVGAVLAIFSYWLTLVGTLALLALGIWLTYRYLMQGGARRWDALG